MAKKFTVGVDVGNLETKSANITFLSAISDGRLTADETGQTPEDYIKYEGRYYFLLNEEPNIPRNEDKFDLENPKMFLLTLMSIAKEIEYTFRSKQIKDTGTYDPQTVKESAEAITSIDLGVGVPPEHLSDWKQPCNDYYTKKFENGVEYEYNGMTFCYTIDHLGVFPQTYAPIVATAKKKGTIVGDNDSFTAIDWGGFTLDIIPFRNRKVSADSVRSYEKGCVVMCKAISDACRAAGYKRIEDNAIIDWLKEGPEKASESELKQFIFTEAKKFAEEVLSYLDTTGKVPFYSRPTVFLGGTSCLLEKYIREYAEEHRFYNIGFIDNPTRCNADAYGKCLGAMVKQQKTA